MMSEKKMTRKIAAVTSCVVGALVSAVPVRPAVRVAFTSKSLRLLTCRWTTKGSETFRLRGSSPSNFRCVIAVFTVIKASTNTSVLQNLDTYCNWQGTGSVKGFRCWTCREQPSCTDLAQGKPLASLLTSLGWTIPKYYLTNHDLSCLHLVLRMDEGYHMKRLVLSRSRFTARGLDTTSVAPLVTLSLSVFEKKNKKKTWFSKREGKTTV